MKKYHYPFTEQQQRGKYRVQAVDMPEICAEANNAADAAAAAKAAFVAALPGYIQENGTLPEPAALHELRHTYVVTFTRAQLLALLGNEQVPEWLE